MSRRYGRNQRRAHRAEIALLRAMLQNAVAGGFTPADGDGLKVDEADVVSYREIRSGGLFELTERSAELTVTGATAQAAIDSWRNEHRLEWRGLKWILTRASHQQRGAGVGALTLELVAFATHQAPRRGPL